MPGYSKYYPMLAMMIGVHNQIMKIFAISALQECFNIVEKTGNSYPRKLEDHVQSKMLKIYNAQAVTIWFMNDY